MFLAQANPLAPAADLAKVKVVIVDDSAVVRGLLTRWLGAEPDVEIAAIAVNGRDAIRLVQTHQPDVVVLDIEMPIMDGLTALPEILKAAPRARVIMASSLTQRGGEVTIRALSAGAADYLAKPDAGQASGTLDYKRDLVQKVRMLGARARRNAPVLPTASQPRLSTPSVKIPEAANSIVVTPNKTRPKAIFIGASTGGPEALGVVIAGMAGKVDVPVFIVQHMPPLFTKILAEHLSKQTGAEVIEAQDGMLAQAGRFYLAPGNFHMTVTHTANTLRIALNSDPHENFCRPAVDPLFRSAAAALGERALAIILTGMGHDGREGAKAMVGKGSMLLAQDEDSSVVWGMPGAVVKAGLATATKPLKEVAPAIVSIMQGHAQ
jgi:two-component system, chemotaxis family, protein-glutamate methylesterase/glutaminase